MFGPYIPPPLAIIWRQPVLKVIGQQTPVESRLAEPVVDDAEFNFAVAFPYNQPIRTDFKLTDNFVANAVVAAYAQYRKNMPQIAADHNLYMLEDGIIYLGNRKFKNAFDKKQEAYVYQELNDTLQPIGKPIDYDVFMEMIEHTERVLSSSNETTAFVMAANNVYARIYGQISREIKSEKANLAESDFLVELDKRCLALLGGGIGLLYKSYHTNDWLFSPSYLKFDPPIDIKSTFFEAALTGLMSIENARLTYSKTYETALGKIVPDPDNSEKATMLKEQIVVEYKAQTGRIPGFASWFDIRSRKQNAIQDWGQIAVEGFLAQNKILAGSITANHVSESIEKIPVYGAKDDLWQTKEFYNEERQEIETRYGADITKGLDISINSALSELPSAIEAVEITQINRTSLKSDGNTFSLSGRYGSPLISAYVTAKNSDMLPYEYSPAQHKASTPWEKISEFDKTFEKLLKGLEP